MASNFILAAFCLLTSFLSQGLLASCCSAATSGGIGSLLSHERAYVEFYNDSHFVFGSFDQMGSFKAQIPAHLPHMLMNQELHIMGRVTNFFLPFIKLPARTSISELQTQTKIDDLTIGARFPLSKEGFVPMGPSISLISSLRLHPKAMGSSLMTLGLALEKGLGRINIGLSYALGAEPNYFKKKGFSNGITQSASFSASFAPSESTKLSVALSPSFNTSLRVNQRPLPYSAKHQVTLSTSFSYKFHSHLTLNTGLGANLPIKLLGKNINSEIFLQAGLRVGVF